CAAIASGEVDAGALREDVADVEERADARARAPLVRYREQEFCPANHLQVAAVGIAEAVLRAEPTLGEAAHRIRPASEELAIWRQRSRVLAESVAVGDLRRQRHSPLLPHREQLQV